MNITDLKQIMDPRARHLFFDDQGFTEAFPIHLVDQNTVIVNAERHKLSSQKRSGYFVGASGKGIVRFTGDVSPLENIKNESLGELFRIQIDPLSLQLINRREFIRKELIPPVAVCFEYDGRVFRASLVNISEGGLRMAVAEPLPTHLVFHFELSLPRARQENFVFKTDGLVVYSDPENDPTQFMTGVSFIAPSFKNDTEKETYLHQRKELAEYLLSNK